MITKGGLNAVTLSLANEYVKDRIRFNAVAPRELLIRRCMEGLEAEEALKARSPMGTITEPEDIAAAVVFYLTAAPTHYRAGAARG